MSDSDNFDITKQKKRPMPEINGNGINGDDILSLLTEVVCDEDKQLIVDVLQAIKICRSPDSLCTSWTVTPRSTGYVLVAYLPRYFLLNLSQKM